MSGVQKVTLNDGSKMPILGLGTWLSETGKVTQAVKDAIDIGYRHIDGARCYQNENEVGAGIQAKIKEGVVKREDLYVVSKLWNTKHRPDMVVPAIRKTLADLGLEYLDLYLIHWPVGYLEDDSGNDNLFPMDPNGKFLPSVVDYVDTWKAMEECVSLGLTKSIGVSNFSAHQISRILEKATIKPAVNQVELHGYLNQKKLEAFCKEKGVQMVAYSPLGSPAIPWETASGVLLEEPKLKAIAKAHNKSPAQVELRWIIQRGIVAIPKSVTKSRIQENFGVWDFTLSDAEMNDMFSLEIPGGKGRRCDEQAANNHQHYPFNDEF